MKKLRLLVASTLMLVGIGLTPLLATTTVSASAKDELCKGAGGTNAKDCAPKGEEKDLPGVIENIVNILLFVIGLVSVVMIVIGGLRYVLSGGDQSAVTGAKNTVLYAVVGLVVAFMAYAIVNFVVKSL